uniref:Uncharacterized protein n=1 Tax=Rhizophora mucronata TaxID=61149 RepID=A0A2P2PFT8_RHIMU
MLQILNSENELQIQAKQYSGITI